MTKRTLKNVNPLFVVLNCLLLLAAHPAQAAAPTYLVSDFGLGSAQGLNNKGQVVGYIYTDASLSNDYAFLWDSTHGLQNLGNLGSPSSGANAINSSGQIVGSSATPDGDANGYLEGFIYSGGTMTDLGNIQDNYSGDSEYPFAINAGGEVVGTVTVAGQISFNSGAQPFTWTSVASGLQIAGVEAGINGINDTGEYVGFVLRSAGDQAFHHVGNGSYLSSDYMGTLGGGTTSEAKAINASGQIVGYSYLSNNTTYHAFHHTGSGTLVATDDLGTLGGTSSVAYGINTAGQVVGSAQASDGTYHAFLWTPNGSSGTMVDLNTLVPACFQMVLNSANGINDQGQIVCTGEEDSNPNYSGTPHAILLTPLSLLTIKDLGTLGGNTSAAYGVNIQAQVVGQADTTTGAHHAFLWNGAHGIQDLGVLPGGSESTASGINSTGQVSGSSYTPIQGPHGFLWKPGGTSGTMTDLGTLGTGGNAGDYSMANGINDAGLLCGVSENSSQNDHMLEYDSNTMTAYDLDQYRSGDFIGGSYSAAYALDSANYYVFGETDTLLGTTFASVFSSSPAKLTEIDPTAYLLPGGSFSRVLAVSNHYSWAGEADMATGDTHAFRFLINTAPTPNSITDLGTLPSDLYKYSSAAGVSDLGLVVGNSYTDTGYHAFLSDGTTMTDLNNWLPAGSGWVLQKATAISNPSQIVGYGTINHQVHAFILGPP
ncbi:MAG: hypothetical protein ACRYFS_19990 [Janthinobacterium lividum]